MQGLRISEIWHALIGTDTHDSPNHPVPICDHDPVTLRGPSVEIDRPVEAVFRYLVDLNDAQWRSSIQAMRLLSPSPDGVGARHVEVRRVPGRSVETVAEVTVYELNRRWAVRRASGPVRPEVSYHLEPTPAGTRLRFTFDIAVLAGVARALRPLVPLVRRLVYRSFGNDLGRLKQRLESTDATG
jgi:hypothetical protein